MKKSREKSRENHRDIRRRGVLSRGFSLCFRYLMDDPFHDAVHFLIFHQKGIGAGLDHLGGGDAGEVHLVSGTLCQDLYVQPLGAAVAFPEWVQGVDLGEIVGESQRHLFFAAAAQVSFLFQLVEDILGLLCDEQIIAEHGSFIDIDIADLAGPAVDVAEDRFVKTAQIGEVHITLGRVLAQGKNPQGGDVAFCFLQLVAVGDIQFVF